MTFALLCTPTQLGTTGKKKANMASGGRHLNDAVASSMQKVATGPAGHPDFKLQYHRIMTPQIQKNFELNSKSLFLQIRI
jgi:hypothetical protein